MKFTLGEIQFRLEKNMLNILATDESGCDFLGIARETAALTLDRADTILLINELQAYLERFEPDGKNRTEIVKRESIDSRSVTLIVHQPTRAIVMYLAKEGNNIRCRGIDEHLFEQEEDNAYQSDCAYSPTGFCHWWEAQGPVPHVDWRVGGLRKFINDFLFKYDAQAVNVDEIESFLNEV